MKTSFRLLLFGSIVLFGGCVRHRIIESAVDHHLGNSLVQTVLYRAEGSDLLLLNLHENENTSVEAGLHLIRRKGGEVLMLRHSGKRMITFHFDNRPFEFDPNRMFTDEGARKTLSAESPAPEGAVHQVRNFATDVLKKYHLDQQSTIVTLHNNTEGSYSVLSYLPGGDYDLDASQVYVNRRRDPDDFYFVTTKTFFEGLKAKGFNVVLQNNRFATDDGSLSVLAGMNGIPYVNVEAQLGHLKEQEKMLSAVFKLISNRK